MIDNTEITNNKTVAKNTIILYGRMLICILISLYSSRLVLQVLGIEDYGIYNAVGGFVTMFAVVSSSLSSATSRFITYELGRKDLEKLKKTFCTSLTIQLFLCIAVFIITESLGSWFVEDKMTIPSGRETAALWVFHCSLISILAGFLTVPFNATIIAHEKMGIYAFISVAEVLLKLMIILYISFDTSINDRLIVYAILWLVVTVLLQSATIIYCKTKFSECKLKLCYDKELLKEIFGFASWSLIGNLSIICSGQGINVIMNLFFGPVVNAARGISVTVNNIVSNFVNSFTTAIHPQITKSYAAEEKERMMNLVYFGTRFSYYTMLLLTLPLLIETDFVLNLWLGKYPEHTVHFVRLAFIVSMIDVLSIILGMAQNATGQIRTIQISTGIIRMLNLPFVYICFKINSTPEFAYFIAIFLAICCLVARIIIAIKYINLDIKDFARKVYVNVFITTLSATILPLLVYMYTKNDCIWEQIAIMTTSIASTCLSVLFVGCTKVERDYIYGIIKKRATLLKY